MSATTEAGEARAAKKREAAAEKSAAMNVGEIRRCTDELVALYERKQDTAAAYADSIEAVAKKGGVSKKALNAFIVARAKKKEAETHALANQLSLLFENV